jgi:hypothetical protein
MHGRQRAEELGQEVKVDQRLQLATLGREDSERVCEFLAAALQA